MPSKPRLFIMIPPPFYVEGALKAGIENEKWKVINEVLPGVVRKMCGQLGERCNVIDLFNPLGGKACSKPELFMDGLHPNDAGAKIIAETVYSDLSEIWLCG